MVDHGVFVGKLRILTFLKLKVFLANKSDINI